MSCHGKYTLINERYSVVFLPEARSLLIIFDIKEINIIVLKILLNKSARIYAEWCKKDSMTIKIRSLHETGEEAKGSIRGLLS